MSFGHANISFAYLFSENTQPYCYRLSQTQVRNVILTLVLQKYRQDKTDVCGSCLCGSFPRKFTVPGLFRAWGSALALLQLAKGSQDLFPTSGPSLWNMLAEKFGNTQPVRFFKTVAERKEERGKFRTYLGKLYPQIPQVFVLLFS